MLKFDDSKFNFIREFVDTTDAKEVAVYNQHQKLLLDCQLVLVENWKGFSAIPTEEANEYIRTKEVLPEPMLEVMSKEEYERAELLKQLWGKLNVQSK